MFVFSSHTCPAHSETSTAALTTPALDRRSLRWFGISACTATPEDPPPSLAQHGSCRRSSTSSSSLPFRTHMGARNLVVAADQGLRAPSGDQESLHDSVHEDSASASIAAGHRPRPSFRHPQGAGDRPHRTTSTRANAISPVRLGKSRRGGRRRPSRLACSSIDRSQHQHQDRCQPRGPCQRRPPLSCGAHACSRREPDLWASRCALSRRWPPRRTRLKRPGS